MHHSKFIDGIKVLVLDDGKANAINDSLLDWLEIEFTPASCKGIIITGNSSFFSAGLDLPRLIHFEREVLKVFINRFQDLLFRLQTAPRPLVAA